MIARRSAERSPREAGLVRSAGILGLGNIASRMIGLAREAIAANLFGSAGPYSAFVIASAVPTMIYDLLVGGALSAALVPVFSEYARPERRAELTRVAGTILTLIALVMAVILILLELLAGTLAGLLGDFADPELQAVLTNSLRVIAPAIVIFGLSGGVTGLLYALKRFNRTAVAAAVFNLGIVIAAPLLARFIDVYALSVGVVVGSILQLSVLTPALRGLGLRPALALNHPAVRRILRLYLPIALGLVITQLQIGVDRRWASAAGEQAAGWMRYATTLIQLPLGLVPVAVSLAALPGLSRHAAAGDWTGFRVLFGRGLRLVLVLLVPATVGLWALAEPTIRLLFQHGQFEPYDTYWTAYALRLYLIGLLFAGVDFLLNYTFYARQNTRTPALVGVIAIGFYLAVALLLKDSLGFLGLVLADSVKQFGHAAIMTILLLRSVGRLRNERVISTLAKALTAALVMGGAVSQVAAWLLPRVPDGKVGELLVVGVAGGTGFVLYLALLWLLRVPEVAGLLSTIKKLARN